MPLEDQENLWAFISTSSVLTFYLLFRVIIRHRVMWLAVENKLIGGIGQCKGREGDAEEDRKGGKKEGGKGGRRQA